jgi:hypothetical protein
MAALGIVVAVLLAAIQLHNQHRSPPPPPTPPIIVPVEPRPTPGPVPIVPRPRWPHTLPEANGKPQEGGKVSPDGKEEITCDLPQSEKKKNVGGRDGAGLCVFTSIEYCARYQNEKRLVNFQADMRKEPGGGYPDKVDKMIAKYGRGTPYIQYEGTDTAILKAALATGRMVGVTYNGNDCHYRGTIAHMVSLVHFSDNWAAISDNNFTGDNQIVWMSPAEFKRRWTGGRAGWCVILLKGPPPPPPHN